MCIVVDKPAGLAVQSGSGVGASLDGLISAMRSERPLLVHRIDRDTSGLVLLAKGKAAAAELSRLFSGAGGPKAGGARAVTKRYLALCSGRPEKDSGAIKLDVRVHGEAKRAETRYRLVEELEGGEFSLLELELATGRMHQIRIHLAACGNPILGDDKHGDFALNRRLRKERGLRRLLLHAARLVIPLMPDGSRLDVSAPLPDHFRDFMLGRANPPKAD